jgi:cyclopropane-fatty-acyl-phospholipid synthase
VWRLLETGAVPDALLRAAIRRIVAERLRDEGRGGLEAQHARHMALLAARRDGPIARHTEAANRQHYEVPAAFFELVLGRRLKYSGGYWPPGVTSLDAGEEAMLALTCERAGVADGMRVLDLGCGWGPLTLWLLERYPRCRVVAVSNSASQRAFIAARAAALGAADRVEVITRDVNDFHPPGTFDRVISVEMIEHTWNTEALFARLAPALAGDGRLFVHIFTHRRFAYAFTDRGPSDWMARTFFTGGSMLADDSLVYAQAHLRLTGHWRVDGTHYQRTAEAWLANLDARRARIDPVLAATYGADQVARWRLNWRLFFMACAELFGHRHGQEWLVSQYLFAPR